jgi:hypothetical protein|tara:strand:- start:645 stop:968 length:324 start_codon:yes stop_codon:yes gene_type:complete
MTTVARGLARDPDWVLGYLYFKKTGRLPRPYGDFVPEHLHAVLAGDLEDAIILNLQRRQYETITPTGFSGKLPSDLTSEPIETGDTLVDKWEREFAEGRVPDLEEKL